MVKHSEVQKSAREFSHDLDFILPSSYSKVWNRRHFFTPFKALGHFFSINGGPTFIPDNKLREGLETKNILNKGSPGMVLRTTQVPEQDLWPYV